MAAPTSSQPARRRAWLESGQGPFKPSTSSRRALFGVAQALRALHLHLARVDPLASLDPSTSDRSLLSGVAHLLRMAEQMEQSASDHLASIKLRSSTGTPLHKDPRHPLREQLEVCRREAKEAVRVMSDEQQRVRAHCDRMRQSIAILQMIEEIYDAAVSQSLSNTLTSTPSSKPNLMTSMPSSKTSVGASVPNTKTVLNSCKKEASSQSPKGNAGWPWSEEVYCPWSCNGPSLKPILTAGGSCVGRGGEAARTAAVECRRPQLAKPRRYAVPREVNLLPSTNYTMLSSPPRTSSSKRQSCVCLHLLCPSLPSPPYLFFLPHYFSKSQGLPSCLLITSSLPHLHLAPR